MKLEICTESIATAVFAGELKIDRIELCSSLDLGGLTPSFGLIEACVSQSKCETHVMIRHKAGDFVYSAEDIKIMSNDIEKVKLAGAHGVVFGCLTATNEIDFQETNLLTEHAKNIGLEVTFHRAFDFVLNPIESLNQLIDIGIDRILTSGGQEKAENGLELIRTLVKTAENRIQIMAGSGINAENANLFTSANVDAIHFSGDLKTAALSGFGMGNNVSINSNKIKAIHQLIRG